MSTFRLASPLLACALALVVAGTAAAGPVFRFGVVNERRDQPDLALRQYGELVDHLADVLAAQGIRVQGPVIAADVDELAALVSAGQVDGFIEGVFPTLRVAAITGSVTPALVAWRKGQRQYHSVFFVRRDDPATGLEDLRGRSIAFEAPRSTSAYALPLATLHRHGIAAEPADTGAADARAVRYVFAGSEDNQAYWVLRGRADAGAFNDGDWERLPETVRAGLRIIHRTPGILRWLVSFHAGLSPAVRGPVEQALLTAHLDPGGRAALQRAERIARLERLAGPEDLQSVEAWRPALSRLYRSP